MDEFPRIKRLPHYVFNIVGELKAAARARGEDIIDFGMGNPDQPTPQPIVDKLCEAAQRGKTHRYSVSRGIPRLRRAICNWYGERFDVDIDGKPENIVTTFCTQRLFANPSIESVAKWKYKPKIIDGRTISRSGVETKVTFRLVDEKGIIVPE